MKKNSYGVFAVFIMIISYIFYENMQGSSSSYLIPVGMLILAYIGFLLFSSYTIRYLKYPFTIFTLISFAICVFMSTIINGLYMSNNFGMTIVIMLLWIIVYLVSYIISRNNNNSFTPFYMLALSFPFITYSYYHVLQNELINRTVLINSVYYMLLFLPIILSIKHLYIKLLGILIICASVIISSKRTALIAIVISISVYYLISLITMESKKAKKIVTSLVMALVVFGGIILLYSYIEEHYGINWLLRMQSLQSDGGSGRDVIWSTTIQMQMDSNLFEWIFGHGIDGVIKSSPFKLSAHNDFLEILYDYGVFALIFYIGFIISLLKTYLGMYRIRFHLCAPFAASLVIYIIMSTFSHLVIYPTYFIYLVIFWGISIAQYENYSEVQVEMQKNVYNDRNIMGDLSYGSKLKLK